MPAADFEFKYLLKRVQLSEEIKPNIVLVTGGEDAMKTVQRFNNFFGDVAGERLYHTQGLTPTVLDHLRELKVLDPERAKY